MFGRRILTTTSVPSFSCARCTCAIEAAASGSASKRANTASGSAPRSSTSCGRRLSSGTAGTRLCSLENSAIHSGPNRSARPARIWPSLTKVGPSSSSARRTCCGGSSRASSSACSRCSTWPARASVSASPSRRTASPRPCRISTPAISFRRPRSRAEPRVSISIGAKYRRAAPRQRPRRTRSSSSSTSVIAPSVIALSARLKAGK